MKQVAEDEMPIFAECGGLMYLTKCITDFNGQKHSMVGLLEAETVMTKKLTLSYTLAEVLQGNIVSSRGMVLKGHEFHYSKVTSPPGDAKFAFSMKIGEGIEGGKEGWMVKNTLASYVHTHLATNLRLPRRFIASCRKYARR
jgi:cobyrinic acid a,c-diamide synthase